MDLMLLFVIVTGMALRDLFLPELSAALTVNLEGTAARGPVVVLPEHVPDPVQEPRGGQQHGGVAEGVQMVEQKLRVNVTLRRRRLQQRDGFLFIAGDIVAAEVQLAKSILRELVSLLGGRGEPTDSSFHIPWNVLPGEIQPAKRVLRELIFLFC